MISKEPRKKIFFPSWLFVLLMVLYNELLLHFWVTEPIHYGRLMAVIRFALGFGGLTALITSLIPKETHRKWTAVGISLVISVFWLAEYFVSDAYQVFMTPKLMISGAGGVATDYTELVISLLVRNVWRIALVLLPVAVYAVFCRCSKVSWKVRGILAAVTIAGYLLGIAAVNGVTPDAKKLNSGYEFDSAVRCFGLNIALTLEARYGSGGQSVPEFQEVPTMPTMETEPATQPSAPAEDTAEVTEPSTEPPVVYGENVIEGLDFAALAESTKNDTIAGLHAYVAAQTPSMKNEYTGLFEGKNLILITAEAFTAQAIDPELTPTLYRMATKGIEFTEYYQPAWGASTTSGEFSNLIGLVPASGGMCMMEAAEQDLFFTMGKHLQRQNYYSAAYHNHLFNYYDRDKTHTHLGYDRWIARYGGLEGVDGVWTESDLQMIEVTVDDYIDQQPFSIYYMTVSGHSIYTKDGNAQARKHFDEVDHLPYSDHVKCYLAAQLEFEYAMEALVKALEDAGIADDTVIVISTDHYPYGLEPSSTWGNNKNYLGELYGVKTVDKFIRDRNALIIWSGCIEDMDLQVDTPVYSLDILPTLSNLFGVEYDSRLLVGRDVFSDQLPLVLWPGHSWCTELGRYDAGTGIFTPYDETLIPEGYEKYISALVQNKIDYSKAVQHNNYFNHLSKILFPRE